MVYVSLKNGKLLYEARALVIVIRAVLLEWLNVLVSTILVYTISKNTVERLLIIIPIKCSGLLKFFILNVNFYVYFRLIC